MQSFIPLPDRTPPKADHRIPYGGSAFQFGDLWLPEGAKEPLPVVVMVHGGWWRSARTLDYAGFACRALKDAGMAVWSLEYRRVGDEGGGFPGTFVDVAHGADFVHELARRFPLDAGRVVTAGHSAGGHLAFWLAGRHHVPAGSPVAVGHAPLVLRGAVSLAGAVDLKATVHFSEIGPLANGAPAVEGLMGARPPQFAERYAAGDPAELLPFGIPQRLVQGTRDEQIPPEVPEGWVRRARAQGDRAELVMVPGATHMDVMDPESRAWAASLGAIRGLLGL